MSGTTSATDGSTARRTPVASSPSPTESTAALPPRNPARNDGPSVGGARGSSEPGRASGRGGASDSIGSPTARRALASGLPLAPDLVRTLLDAAARSPLAAVIVLAIVLMFGLEKAVGVAQQTTVQVEGLRNELHELRISFRRAEERNLALAEQGNQQLRDLHSTVTGLRADLRVIDAEGTEALREESRAVDARLRALERTLGSHPPD